MGEVSDALTQGVELSRGFMSNYKLYRRDLPLSAMARVCRNRRALFSPYSITRPFRKILLSTERSRLFRWMLLITVALAVPILPFLGFGESAESQIADWLDASLSPSVAAAMVIGLLAADIFLPVPSSVVSTFAGKMLGFWAGTASSWCGMTIGVVAAFWLVRIFGRSLARRLSSEEELARMDALVNRYGVLILVLTRPIPVFAEASVLLMGTMRLGWRRFFIAVGFSNLGIAAVYAALGDRVQLPMALAASIVVPLVATGAARCFWPASTRESP
jgi:uncharacterized membrane protein YdjX (TVP38/TMEM64 family)